MVVMLQDECSANAVLAIISKVRAAKTPHSQHEMVFRRFQNAAMSRLRSRVADSSGLYTKSTFLAVLGLLVSESISGNISAAQLHLKMAHALIRGANGLAELDSRLRENLICCDVYLAERCGTKPLFSPQDYGLGGIEGLDYDSRTAQRRKEAYMEGLTDVAYVDPNLQEIFGELHQLMEICEELTRVPNSMREGSVGWVRMKSLECRSRILSLYADSKSLAHSSPQPRHLQCSCLALLVWMGLLFGSSEPICAGQRLLHRLQYAVDELERTEGQEDGLLSLRIWILHMGVLQSKVLLGGARAEVQFQTRIKNLANGQGLFAREQVVSVLRRYLFSKDLNKEIGRISVLEEADEIEGFFMTSGKSWRDRAIFR